MPTLRRLRSFSCSGVTACAALLLISACDSGPGGGTLEPPSSLPSISNLRITEMRPSTREDEVANGGDDLCRRYSSSDPTTSGGSDYVFAGHFDYDNADLRPTGDPTWRTAIHLSYYASMATSAAEAILVNINFEPDEESALSDDWIRVPGAFDVLTDLYHAEGTTSSGTAYFRSCVSRDIVEFQYEPGEDNLHFIVYEHHRGQPFETSIPIDREWTLR